MIKTYLVALVIIISILFVSEVAFGQTRLFPYQGGTGATTTPLSGQLLIGTSGNVYIPAWLTAGSNITITTSSGAITIESTGGGGSGSVSTSSPITQYHFPYWATTGGGLSGTSTAVFTPSLSLFEIRGVVSSSNLTVGGNSTTTSLTIGGDYLTDITGDGLFLTGNALTVTTTIQYFTAGTLSTTRGGLGFDISTLDLNTIPWRGGSSLTSNANKLYFNNAGANARLIINFSSGSDGQGGSGISVGSGALYLATTSINQFGATVSLGSTTIDGQTTTTALTISGLSNALLLAGSGGAVSGYGGDTEACGGTDQVTSLTVSATGTISITCSAQGSGGGADGVGVTTSSPIFSNSIPFFLANSSSVITTDADLTYNSSTNALTLIGLSFTNATGTTLSVDRLSNLTSNGFVKTGSGDGTLSVDTNTYLTAAITSLNSQTGASQTFSTSTGGASGFDITSSGNVHTLRLATSSASRDGLLISADWTTFNNKVGTSRTINTTSPLSGGGDLSADRTLSFDFSVANTWTGIQTFNNTSTFNATAKFASSTASRCARFDANQNLVAATGDCTAGDTTGASEDFWDRNNPFVYLATSTDLLGVGATSTYKLTIQASDTSSSTLSIQALAGQTGSLLNISSSTTNFVNISATGTVTINDGLNATATIQLGAVSSTACMVLRDSDDAGFTYLTVLDGLLYTNTSSCE